MVIFKFSTKLGSTLATLHPGPAGLARPGTKFFFVIFSHTPQEALVKKFWNLVHPSQIFAKTGIYITNPLPQLAFLRVEYNTFSKGI